MSTDTSAPIVVSALVIRNSLGEVLTVRKRGTTGFMLPGGKPEPGETAEETARREAAEDVNVIDKWRGSAIALWRGSAIALWRAGPTSHRKLSS
ncbi:NUDIX domain-containing protein [Rothia nasimurium]|uniref:NUDIX domain-containing protein n=1 Tax=Rothia nasimurium TaxID=85336 RepID=UPI001F1E389E|nr:NUDIX domain-containing protein [Rothia nasimurium]